MKKEELIEKEVERLEKLFEKLPENRKGLAKRLIENASFMSVTLDELKVTINKEGVKEKYKNGQNQYGYKDSTEAKYYDKLICNYSKVIKQLNDMLPKDEPPVKADDFEEFE